MTARYLVGDVLEVLPTLEPGSVDLILTSPPFLALRSYLPADHPDKAKEGGSQPTPGAFIDWLVDVVEALDRVLAPYGSMVIELGDTYAGSGGAGGDYDPGGFRDGQPGFRGSGRTPAGREVDTNEKYERVRGEGFRQGLPNLNHKKQGGGTGWPADKSLTLIPELFRMTLVYGFNPLTGRQTKRWRLRNVIRWVRPNPPVGALGDKFRPATSELMVFCRTDEAGRRRFFDLDAVREPHARPPESRALQTRTERWDQGVNGADLTRASFVNEGNPAGAPPLDWWNIPPGGYQGAHYAVFPEALCVRPIKAMCPEKVCRTCGEPSRRIVETNYDGATWPSGGTTNGLARQPERVDLPYSGRTSGFTDCGHDDYRPGLVLDPFAGSGTTLAVAVGHGRDAIGIDLDERNARLAEERIGFFLEVVDTIT